MQRAAQGWKKTDDSEAWPYRGRETHQDSDPALGSRDCPPHRPTHTHTIPTPTLSFFHLSSDPLRWKNGSSVWKLILRARTVPLYFKDVPWKNPPPPSIPPPHWRMTQRRRRVINKLCCCCSHKWQRRNLYYSCCCWTCLMFLRPRSFPLHDNLQAAALQR